MAPNYSHLKVFILLGSPLPHWIIGLLCTTNMTLQKWQYGTSEATSWNTLLCPSFGLRLLTLREASFNVMKTLKQPCEKSYMGRNWGFLPTTSTSLLVMWVKLFESRSSSSSQEDCSHWQHLSESHETYWGKTAQPSCSWIPDPQTLRDLKNAYFCFTLLSLCSSG